MVKETTTATTDPGAPAPGESPTAYPGKRGDLRELGPTVIGYKRQVPSVGRFVHYFAYGTPGGEFPAGVARAAVVTQVDDPGNPESALGLCVLNPTGMFFNLHVPYGPGKPGHWDWPPYVPPVEAQAEQQEMTLPVDLDGDDGDPGDEGQGAEAEA
jgi:hypothetical protein